jgi:hypothetical protein
MTKEPIVVDIGAAMQALQASPELADTMNKLLGVPRWQPIDDVAKYGHSVLLARWNDCAWEYAVAFWTDDKDYPWQSANNAYPDGRFTHYLELTPPYEVTE